MLQALGIDRFKLMDVLARSVSLSQPKRQLAVNTPALSSPLHSNPSPFVSYALQQSVQILEEDVIRIKKWAWSLL